MNPRSLLAFWILSSSGTLAISAALDNSPRYTNVINVTVPSLATDKSVRYDR